MKKKSVYKRNIRRRAITLIEIMIVMFLIAMITGVVAYNYRGTLDEGKAFKTKAGMARLESILSFALADAPNADLSGTHWQEYVRASRMVTDAEALMKDGWGEYYQVSYDTNTHAILIHSQRYESYKNQNPTTAFKN